jgi:peptide-methionine (R)-S-oxide reductase
MYHKLSDIQHKILQEKYTEPAFSGIYHDFFEKGVYSCAGCGSELFSSEVKFDAGCGWPSFWEAIDKSKLEFKTDLTHLMIRTEVLCKTCGGHLGHVFNDGPKPTGKRYCINSGALSWKKDE